MDCHPLLADTHLAQTQQKEVENYRLLCADLAGHLAYCLDKMATRFPTSSSSPEAAYWHTYGERLLSRALSTLSTIPSTSSR